MQSQLIEFNYLIVAQQVRPLAENTSDRQGLQLTIEGTVKRHLANNND